MNNKIASAIYLYYYISNRSKQNPLQNWPAIYLDHYFDRGRDWRAVQVHLSRQGDHGGAGVNLELVVGVSRQDGVDELSVAVGGRIRIAGSHGRNGCTCNIMVWLVEDVSEE